MERKTFITFINILEGFKTTFKEYHWISKNSNYHTLLGEILSELDSYQDNFAEEGIIIYGEIIKGEIVGNKTNTIDPMDAINQTILTVEKIMEMCKSSGIINLSAEFIHKLNKFIYLMRMN